MPQIEHIVIIHLLLYAFKCKQKICVFVLVSNYKFSSVLGH